MPFLFVALTVTACLSPLLTFARLFQVKEWRWDRLRSHLDEEGWLRSLFGITRPALFAVAGLFVPFFIPDPPYWTLAILGAFTALNAMQVILRRQPLPVWTQKALVLVATSIIFTVLISFFILHFTFYIDSIITLALIPLLQPFILLLSWFLWLPVDTFLKNRILNTARVVRARFPDLVAIGVTGSVGKTTTKELLVHVLSDVSPIATPSHVNSEIGVAQWMIKELATRNSQLVTPLIVEMGAYRSGEISLLCSITQPRIGVLTFIGHQHTALFGSEDAIKEAKAELLRSLPSSGRAFINGDCQLCRDATHGIACPVTVVGTGGRADLEAFDIEETPQGLQFRVGQTVVRMAIHGTQNITNVLLAIAVAEHLGLKRDVIVEKLRSFRPPRHTFEVRETRGVTILDDTHNASPASVKAAIAWARNQPMQEKVLLASGLIELGEVQERIVADWGANAAPVLTRAVFLHRKSAVDFARGFGKPVELLAKDTARVTPGSLLLCIGRMPQTTIDRLLP